VPKKKGSTKEEVDRRLDRVETMLDSGVPPSSVVREIAREYGVSRRQARNYVVAVAARVHEQIVTDLPFARTQLISKNRRFYAKAIAEKEFGAAQRALATEAKLIASLPYVDPVVVDLIKAHGKPPRDPGRRVNWAQGAAAIELFGLLRNPTLDPVRRYQILGDLSAKIGIVQDKAEGERKLAELELAAGTGDADAVPIDAEVDDADQEPSGEDCGD
jgi:hypothetical protein